MLQQGFVGDLHGHSRSEHRVDQNKRLAVQMRGSQILGDYLYLLLPVDITPQTTVSTQESVLGLVEHIEETLVQGKPCTENCPQDNLVGDSLYLGSSEGRLHGRGRIMERLADLVCHQFAQTLDITTEMKTVLLDIDIAYFTQVLTDKRVLLG